MNPPKTHFLFKKKKQKKKERDKYISRLLLFAIKLELEFILCCAFIIPRGKRVCIMHSTIKTYHMIKNLLSMFAKNEKKKGGNPTINKKHAPIFHF